MIKKKICAALVITMLMAQTASADEQTAYLSGQFSSLENMLRQLQQSAQNTARSAEETRLAVALIRQQVEENTKNIEKVKETQEAIVAEINATKELKKKITGILKFLAGLVSAATAICGVLIKYYLKRKGKK